MWVSCYLSWYCTGICSLLYFMSYMDSFHLSYWLSDTLCVPSQSLKVNRILIKLDTTVILEQLRGVVRPKQRRNLLASLQWLPTLYWIWFCCHQSTFVHLDWITIQAIKFEIQIGTNYYYPTVHLVHFKMYLNCLTTQVQSSAVFLLCSVMYLFSFCHLKSHILELFTFLSRVRQEDQCHFHFCILNIKVKPTNI